MAEEISKQDLTVVNRLVEIDQQIREMMDAGLRGESVDKVILERLRNEFEQLRPKLNGRPDLKRLWGNRNFQGE